MNQKAFKSDELFSKIFHASPFAMNLFRLADGCCVDVNNAHLSLTGYSREEFLNHTAAELNLFVDQSAPSVWMKEIKECGSARLHETQIRRKSGEIRDVIGSVELIEVDGEKFGLVMATDITERQQAQRELQSQLKRLEALREIDIAIVGTTNLSLTLKTILEQVVNTLSVDAADILLLNPHSNILEFAAGRGFRTKGIEKTQQRIGQGHAGRAALEHKIATIPDLNHPQESFLRASLIKDENFVFFCAAPLVAQGNLVGVLEVFHRSSLSPQQNWLGFLEALAGQASIAIESSRLFHDLKHANMSLIFAYDETIEGWSKALDLRDKETEGHTLRVTEMTIALARNAGISESEIIHVRRGALLHDIGKMGVPDSILLKPDKLTDDEWVIMRKHPTFAYELLYPIEYLRPALSIPYSHHEKWDGTGYPQGLKGEQIPLPARLFAVVDVWDALSNDRPYRKSWPQELVAKHIHEQSGTHFDPQAVELFLQVLSRDEPKAG